MKSEIYLLRQQISELEVEAKTENIKLMQELKIGIKELEKNRIDTATENAELKAKVMKLEQKQSQNEE
jgi:hypothetical protein